MQKTTIHSHDGHDDAERRLRWALTALALALMLGVLPHRVAVAAPTTQPSATDVHQLPPAPHDPATMGEASRPQIVLLTASWCQWCKVLETRSLPDAHVQQVLRRRFAPLRVADVDRAPLWMDLPGVAGLPSLAFFDAKGHHAITRAGYRPPDELAFDLDVIADRLEQGTLVAEALTNERSLLTGDVLGPRDAAALLARIERVLFLKVNDADGGFLSPSRHPFPSLLVELERYRALGAPARVGQWVDRTVQSALRGSSPRLRDEPLPDMTFTGEELIAMTRPAAASSARWMEGVTALPEMDPWLGLQDPVDGGVFRYAAGPGWYHPHFERRAIDNLAWAQLLRLRGEPTAAAGIERFVFTTFRAPDGHLYASQASTPFYFRLRVQERKAATAPAVDPLVLLSVQARAAHLRPRRCASLARLAAQRWGDDPFEPSAEPPARRRPTADEVGEVLEALASCPGDDEQALARAWAEKVTARWRTEGLASSPRLFRLVAGVCAAAPRACPRALATLRALEIDPHWAPPLVPLARTARR